jgi:hypothetical protein
MAEIKNTFVTRQLLRQAMPSAPERIIIAFESLFSNNNLIVESGTSGDGSAGAAASAVLQSAIFDAQESIGGISLLASGALARSNYQQEDFPLQYPDPMYAAMVSQGDAYSFTPAIEGLTLPGVGTYTTQEGSAQRIGNRIYFSLRIVWTAHTGTGALRINTGLGAVINARPCNIVPSSFTWGAGALVATISGNAGVLLFNSASGAANTPVAITATGTLSISGFFEV